MAEAATPTDTGQDAAGTGAAASVRTLPDDVFDVEDGLINIGAEEKPDAVIEDGTPETDADKPADTQPDESDKPDDAAKTDEGTPADKAASDADTDADAATLPPFDADAWAVQQGIDRDLVKYCKTEREALDAVARRLVNQQALMGRWANERGADRTKAADTPAAETDAAATAMQSLPDDQREQLQEWLERDPVQANLWILQNFGGGIIEQAVARQMAAESERQRVLRQQQDIEAERDALFAAHPDARSPNVQEAMRQVYADVGHDDFPFEDAYAVVQAKGQDAPRARDIIDLMRRGVDFATASDVVDAKKVAAVAKAEAATATAKRADATANTASAARRLPAGAGDGQHVPRAYPTVRDLPDEYFEGDVA